MFPPCHPIEQHLPGPATRQRGALIDTLSRHSAYPLSESIAGDRRQRRYSARHWRAAGLWAGYPHRTLKGPPPLDTEGKCTADTGHTHAALGRGVALASVKGAAARSRRVLTRNTVRTTIEHRSYNRRQVCRCAAMGLCHTQAGGPYSIRPSIP